MFNKKEDAVLEAQRDRLRLWRKDANYWVQDIFGGNIKLSNQQADGFRELGKICSAHIKASKGLELTVEEQRYAGYIGINIPSGMGTGKDFWASLCALYWLYVWPVEKGQHPHGLATANTSTQLTNVLWRQISVLPAMSVPENPEDPNGPKHLEGVFVCQQKKIFRKEFGGRSYFFEAVTIPPTQTEEEQAKSLTGRHSPYMLMILDEAAGLPEPVFWNLESTLTGRLNLIIMIYNPIKSRGYPIEARKSDSWLTLNWNAEETVFGDPHLDNPIKSRNADLLKRYGRDSNAYRIRVLGRPPMDDKEVFIPWDWVQDAVERDIEPAHDDPVIMGIDVGAGGDNSAIAIRKGPKIMAIYRKNTPKSEHFYEWALEVAKEWNPDAINVDCIGVGWGTTGFLRKKGYKVYSIDVRETARDRDKYDLVREELWHTLRNKFEYGEISIPNDQELINQLGSIKVKHHDKKGRPKMPTKEEMKRKDSVGGSPDDAESICMTLAIADDVVFHNANIDEEELAERKRRKRLQRGRGNSVTGY
jgi:hypothetical protein